MLDIAEFKANALTLGGARPALFYVQIGQKAIGTTTGEQFDKNVLAKVPYLCRAASLPPSMIDQVSIPYMGRNIKIAGDRSYQDWELTFMNDEDFGIREMFEKWHNDINGIETNVRNSSLTTENYKVDMQVFQLGKAGSIIRCYSIVGAFPTVVSPINLDWEARNQIEVFRVNFAIDYVLPDESVANTTVPYYSDAVSSASGSGSGTFVPNVNG